MSAFVFIHFNCFQFSLSFILLIKSFIHLYITFCTFIHLNIYTSHFVLLNCFVFINCTYKLFLLFVFKKFHELLVCKNAKYDYITVYAHSNLRAPLNFRKGGGPRPPLNLSKGEVLLNFTLGKPPPP